MVVRHTSHVQRCQLGLVGPVDVDRGRFSDRPPDRGRSIEGRHDQVVATVLVEIGISEDHGDAVLELQPYSGLDLFDEIDDAGSQGMATGAGAPLPAPEARRRSPPT